MRSTPDNTIVTGAAGWLGTAVTHALVEPGGEWERGGTIRALVRSGVEADRLARLSPSIEPVVGDLLELESLDRLFAGLVGEIDVLHIAGVIHPVKFDDFYAFNLHGTKAILAKSGQHAVRRFVHVSSNSPFGTNSGPDDRFRNEEPYHPYYGYGDSKMQAELAVFEAIDAGLEAVLVRPPWFYGPHQPPRQTKFFKMVRTGRFPVFAGGHQSRSMVYVDNLVQGLMRAELTPTAAGLGWWIADERPYSITEIVETVGRALADEGFEVSPNRLRVPDIVARVAEFTDKTIQRSGRYHQQIHVLGEMNKHIACDISAARRDLGYRPQVALYEGMRRSIRWCVDQGLDL